jgi:hypothetical protein
MLLQKCFICLLLGGVFISQALPAASIFLCKNNHKHEKKSEKRKSEKHEPKEERSTRRDLVERFWIDTRDQF